MRTEVGRQQRVVILMLDGLGLDYYAQRAKAGVFAEAKAVIPSVTNVHLHDQADAERVTTVLRSLAGVEQVMSRAKAAQELRLMPDRIGDLVVLGDSDTVFGHLDSVESEVLPPTYRNHGSAYELEIPLVIHNARGAPSRDYFSHNLDLARWLYAGSEIAASQRGSLVTGER
jgi:hypothetical protein